MAYTKPNGERERRLADLKEYASALREIVSRTEAKGRALVAVFGEQPSDPATARKIEMYFGQGREARSMLRGIAKSIGKLEMNGGSNG